MSSTASDCFGANRILVAMALLLRERDSGGQTRCPAVDAGGMARAGGVLDQPRVAGAEEVLGAIAQPDLELAREDDHELPARRGMPVDEVADRALPKRNLGGREPLGPRRGSLEIDRLDVGLPVGAGVEPECLYDSPRRGGLWRERGDYSTGGAWRDRGGRRGPTNTVPSLDDLIRSQEQGRRNGQPAGLRRLQVDGEVVPARPLDGQRARRGALEDSIHVARGEPKVVGRVGAVRHQSPVL